MGSLCCRAWGRGNRAPGLGWPHSKSPELLTWTCHQPGPQPLRDWLLSQCSWVLGTLFSRSGSAAPNFHPSLSQLLFPSSSTQTLAPSVSWATVLPKGRAGGRQAGTALKEVGPCARGWVRAEGPGQGQGRDLGHGEGWALGEWDQGQPAQGLLPTKPCFSFHVVLGGGDQHRHGPSGGPWCVLGHISVQCGYGGQADTEDGDRREHEASRGQTSRVDLVLKAGREGRDWT